MAEQDGEERGLVKKKSRSLNIPWSSEIRDAAMRMYITQEVTDLDEISEVLGPPVSTLRSWQQKDKWTEKRKAAFSIVQQKSYETAIAELNARRQTIVEDIDFAMSEAREGLRDPDLYFKDKKQAADVLRDNIKLVMEMYEREEPKILLTEIGRIILDIVKDSDERQQIGQALLSFEKSWRK